MERTILSTLTDFVQRLFSLVFVAIMLSGCAFLTSSAPILAHNVTDSPRYHQHYKLEQVYSIKRTSMLVPKDDYQQIKALCQINPQYDEEEFDTMMAISSYRDPWYVEYIEDKPEPKGMIEVGTRFRVIGFYRLKYWWEGEISRIIVEPVAEIIDGSYKGSVFSVSELSKKVWSTNDRNFTYKPNDTIELVE